MRKNDKFRDYEDNLIGARECLDYQNNYEASDDGFSQPQTSNHNKKNDSTNLKDNRPKGRGPNKQDFNSKKEFGGFGGGKSSQIDPDNFFSNYEDFQPGMDFKNNKTNYLPQGNFQDPNQQMRFKPQKEELGNPSAGGKVFYNTMSNMNQNSTLDKKRNQHKGENLERIQFYNSKTQFSLENNLGQLNIHGEDDDDLDENLSYGFKGKSKPLNDNQQKKDKKKKKGNINVNQGKGGNPHGDRENDYGKRKGNNRKQHEYGGFKGGRDALDDHSISSELGIENESTQDLPDMMQQPMLMQQFPQQGQMQPQFMQPVFVNNNYHNPMMNQFKQGMYPQQCVQMPINNNQQFAPQMQQQFYAPRMGNPNFGQNPYQNFCHPQMGVQNMMFDPRLVRLPLGGQPQFNQNFNMQQFKPIEQPVGFNNMQLIQNQMQGVKEMGDKQILRGQSGVPMQFDQKFLMNQQMMQDSQLRMNNLNLNQRVNNPMIQQGAFPVMSHPQSQFPIPSQIHMQMQGIPSIQPRMPNPLMNQNWMIKQEEIDKDSDSNPENKENKFIDFGQDDFSNPNTMKYNQQMFRSPQEPQYPGYGDFMSEKQVQQPHKAKVPFGGFNYAYSEEGQNDNFKSEIKLSESKYFQDYQKYNQQSQEKLDINAKEYVPNQHLLN